MRLAILLAAFISLPPAAGLAAQATRPALIPWPASYQATGQRWVPGRAITIGNKRWTNDQVIRLTAQLRGVLQAGLGVPVTMAGRGEPADVMVEFILDNAAVREAYHLVITPQGVTLTATGDAGLFYGIQTLRQLIASPGNGAAGLPTLEIYDNPRFKWRGLHLDVSRHFYSVEFVKRYIDLMSQYKYNTFHWHLTDDQGWRFPVEGYPRFTSVGGFRRETMKEKNFDPYIGDSTPHGGFYTRDQIREVVRYAADRFITVVPEIEMPGHAMAAVAAYPRLACTPGPFEVGTVWGVEKDILCPTEYTFAVLEVILRQVIGLFPSQYIHIGGDEVPKDRWKESAFAQELMRREGLKSEEELQSWFIRRIERFLSANERKLVGWDEILEGGIAPAATVMSWRGTAGGIEAARQGHDVIMSPGSHVYFDHYQGDRANEPLAIGGYTPLEKVYAFEPVPPELSAREARHILGAQANMWTEYVATGDHIEYMVYPRALALSEVLWSPAAARDWVSFTERLPAALRLLDLAGVNYRIPDVFGLEGDQLLLADSATVTLRAGAGGTIRYTLDGSLPDSSSPAYAGPFVLPLVKEGTTVTARLQAAGGRLGAPRRAVWRKGVHLDAQRGDTAGLAAGLTYRYGEGRADSVGGVALLAPARTGVVPTVQLRGDETGDRFGVTLEGWIRVPSDAIWEFALSSDDGSVLWIDDLKVIDHDGFHAPEAKHGAVPLRGGLHKIRVVMFQGGGAKALSLGWRRQGEAAFTLIPTGALWR